MSYWAGLGDEEKVLEAIKELADIDKVDAQGQTPLHWACDNGYAKVVEILLDNGASINSKVPSLFLRCCAHVIIYACPSITSSHYSLLYSLLILEQYLCSSK